MTRKQMIEGKDIYFEYEGIIVKLDKGDNVNCIMEAINGEEK